MAKVSLGRSRAAAPVPSSATAKPTAKVTMADVARLAGVSKQTVSRVLNGTGRTGQGTTLRVQRVIRELGYRPSGVARSLATNSSLTIGLVVPALDNPYYADIAQALNSPLGRRGTTCFYATLSAIRGVSAPRCVRSRIVARTR